MAKERLSMRKIREVLRLKWEFKLNRREITESCGVKRSTISDYLRRAKKAGLSWPLVEKMYETELEQLLFPPRVSTEERFVPDWQNIHHELKKKHVTLILLWDEYKAKHPDGYQYSQFCVLLRVWQQKLNLVMRQEHLAGEKLFVDYCGQTIPIHSRDTGQIHQAQIFVAVLGASNYTFAEATKSQTLPDWIRSHERAFQFFGGVPELVVPDNLKSGVSSACRYDPDYSTPQNLDSGVSSNSHKNKERIMSAKRKLYKSEFKAKVAIAAIRGDETSAQLSQAVHLIC